MSTYFNMSYLYIGGLMISGTIIVLSFYSEINKCFKRRMRILSSIVLLGIVIYVSEFIPEQLFWYSVLFRVTCGATLCLVCIIDAF